MRRYRVRLRNWRGSLRWLMARHRPITTNGWRSSTGTKMSCRRGAHQKEGRGDTEYLQTVYASPQITPKQKEPAIPPGSGMPRTSPQRVLKDLGTWLGGPKLHVTPRIPPVRRRLDLTSMQEGDLEEL